MLYACFNTNCPLGQIINWLIDWILKKTIQNNSQWLRPGGGQPGLQYNGGNPVCFVWSINKGIFCGLSEVKLCFKKKSKPRATVWPAFGSHILYINYSNDLADSDWHLRCCLVTLISLTSSWPIRRWELNEAVKCTAVFPLCGSSEGHRCEREPILACLSILAVHIHLKSSTIKQREEWC